jgi:hypothetical protein
VGWSRGWLTNRVGHRRGLPAVEGQSPDRDCLRKKEIRCYNCMTALRRGCSLSSTCGPPGILIRLEMITDSNKPLHM